MKNSNDTIGNRTRDLPACSAVPQPTAPPRANNCSSSLWFYRWSVVVAVLLVVVGPVVTGPTTTNSIAITELRW